MQRWGLSLGLGVGRSGWTSSSKVSRCELTMAPKIFLICARGRVGVRGRGQGSKIFLICARGRVGVRGRGQGSKIFLICVIGLGVGFRGWNEG